MLKLLKSKSAMATIALILVILSLIFVRVLRRVPSQADGLGEAKSADAGAALEKPAADEPRPEPDSAAGSASGVAVAESSRQAPDATTATKSTSTPAPVPQALPEPAARPAGEKPAAVVPSARSGVQPETAATAPPRPAAETATPVATKPPPPPLFQDARGLDAPVASAPARESVEPVPPRPQALAFQDTRAPILVQQQPIARLPSAEAPSVRASRPPVEVAAGAAPAMPRPQPSFSDQRQLVPASEAAATAPNQPTSPASQTGTRPTFASPRFVDARDPSASEQSLPSARSVQPAREGVAAAQPTAAQPAATLLAAAQLAAAQSTAAQSAAPPRSVACAPAQIGSEPLDGGRMLVRVGSACRADQTIRFAYGDANLVRRLDHAGRLELTLDLFAGTASPIEIVFEDGSSRELAARAADLDKLEKIALVWRAPVDLDLHAFEYGATFGQAGHVWSQAPSSALAAREQTAATKRGRGFMSRIDGGGGEGDKIEVYTFFRTAEQAAGVVAIAVDYASRGDVPSGPACGTGAQSQVRFETVVSARGRVTREAGVLSAAPCGVPLTADARFGIVHQIRVNR